MYRDGARRERFLFQGEQCLNQSVCVRAGRAAGLALWAGRKMSTAQLYTVVTLLVCERRWPWKPESFWLPSVLRTASAQKCSFTRQARVTSLVDRFVDSFRPAGYHLALAYDDALRSRLCGFRLSHHVMSRVLSHYIDL